MPSECSFEQCPAKIHIDSMTKRLDTGSSEFEQMRKDSRELGKQILQITTHQTKISADLMVHMNKSDDKHNEVIRLISSLGESIKQQGKNLDSHTKDEMTLQTRLIGKLDSIEKKQDNDHIKVNLLWGGVGIGIVAVVILAWDLVRKYVFGL